MKYKSILNKFLLILTIFTLTSCSETKNTKNTNFNDNVNLNNYTKITEKFYVNKTIDTNTTEKVEVNDYKLKHFIKENIISAITPDKKDIVFEEKNYVEKNEKQYKSNLKDGSSYVFKEISNGSINFFEYRNDITKLDLEALGHTLFKSNYDGIISNRDDLPFKSTAEIKSDANKLVSKILKSDNFVLDIMPVTKERMKKYRDEMNTTDKTRKQRSDTNTTGNEDFYFISVIPVINSIQLVSNEMIGSPESQFYTTGNYFFLTYTSRGIESVSAMNLVFPGEEMNNKITVNQIDTNLMDKITKNYSASLDENVTYLESINLMYLPSTFTTKDDVKIIPAWRATFITYQDGRKIITNKYFRCPGGEILNER